MTVTGKVIWTKVTKAAVPLHESRLTFHLHHPGLLLSGPPETHQKVTQFKYLIPTRLIHENIHKKCVQLIPKIKVIYYDM